MNREPASHRPLEHTADVGIEVEAPSRDELFAEAAVALGDTLTPRDGVRAELEREVTLEADGEELLLVDFLSEVLYLFETEGFVVRDARVTVGGEGGRRATCAGDAPLTLSATLEGERYDEARHPLRWLVKAVTYHGLEVRRDGERWRARVLFDL